MTLTDGDRAVFTVRRKSGAVLIEKVIAPMDGIFYVPFVNEETDGWRPDVYSWDLRIALEAEMDEAGSVIDGREVITPWPPSRLEVVKVVGEV